MPRQETFVTATAIRSVLETFSIQVYFYQLLQQQNLLDFLASNYADCNYVIWWRRGLCQNGSRSKLIES